jgi:uncharacterized coiled-coil protein SlyX
MADEVNLVLEHLKRFQLGQDRIEPSLAELVVRMGRVEKSLADLHSQLAEHSLRMDGTNARIDRIERRLELS